MPVEIVNSGASQNNETFNVNTTGAEFLVVMGGCNTTSYSSAPTCDGVASSNYWAMTNGSARVHAMLWVNPNQGATKSVATKLFEANHEDYWWALKNVINWTKYQDNGNHGDYIFTLTHNVNIPTGLMLSVGRTARSGYAISITTGYTDQTTVDRDANWLTYQLKIGHRWGSSSSNPNSYSHTLSAESNGAMYMLALEGPLGKSGYLYNPIVGLFEKMKRRTKLYQELLAKGAIPLGNQELLPI